MLSEEEVNDICDSVAEDMDFGMEDFHPEGTEKWSKEAMLRISREDEDIEIIDEDDVEVESSNLDHDELHERMDGYYNMVANYIKGNLSSLLLSGDMDTMEALKLVSEISDRFIGEGDSEDET